jgi:hypothetical protein
MRQEMDINLHVYFHGDQSLAARLAHIDTTLSQLVQQGGKVMATLDELVQLGTDIKAAVAPLPQAVNDLEAKITAALSGVLTPEQQAKVDAAFADFKEAMDSVTAAVTDATDNVDENAP